MKAVPSPSLFDDGARYERSMGAWSRLAGHEFLNWLRPPPNLRWIDVGCGNGAFTELLMERCAPIEILGIDRSDAQLSFARARLPCSTATFRQGDAMSLPVDAGRFDAAVMTLVIFFIPNPAKAVAEMVRVVRPGGVVAAYVWDILAGGSPSSPIADELRKMGISLLDTPLSSHASRVETLRDLWTGGGLEGIQTHTIHVRRSFGDFDDFWTSMSGTATIRRAILAMARAEIERLKDNLRIRLGVAGVGPVSYEARANAVSGQVPSR